MKKKIIVAVLIAVAGAWLLCNFLYKTKYDAYESECQEEYVRDAMASGTLRLKVSIVAKQTEYYHLGEDISITHKCNGVSVRDGGTVSAKKTMNFKTTITEHDSVDDVGEGSATISLSNSGTGYARTTITVKERGGKRYKNAYAKWIVSYYLEPDFSDMDKIGYWEVVFS